MTAINFEKYNMNFTRRNLFRSTADQRIAIDKIVKKKVDEFGERKFKDFSHFMRVAALKLLREETQRKNK